MLRTQSLQPRIDGRDLSLDTSAQHRLARPTDLARVGGFVFGGMHYPTRGRAHLHTLAEENGQRPSLASDVDDFNVRIDRIGETLNERAPSRWERRQTIEQPFVAHGRKATDGLTRHSA